MNHLPKPMPDEHVTPVKLTFFPPLTCSTRTTKDCQVTATQGTAEYVRDTNTWILRPLCDACARKQTETCP